MAQPPAGSSLLFGALADSARIKQRKNGSYRMLLKGVDEIDWFTDRPDRVAGEWSPKKLVKEWDVLFSDGAPNAQMSYTWKSFIDFAGPIEGRGSMSFEMFKPSVNKKGTKLSFKVKGIGKKNKELVAAQVGRDVEDISLFIDDGITGDSTVTMKVWNDSQLWLNMKSVSTDAVFGEPTRNNDHYTDAELVDGAINFKGGLNEEFQSEGIFTVPVTLKNGLQEPTVNVEIESMPPLGLSDGQCYQSTGSNNGPTTIYYSINGGATQSVEATCGMMM